jgi:hypothetical protein
MSKAKRYRLGQLKSLKMVHFILLSHELINALSIQILKTVLSPPFLNKSKLMIRHMLKLSIHSELAFT